MEHSTDQAIQSTRDQRTYRFLATDVGGDCQKVVQFSPTGIRGFYNLAVGDWPVDGAMQAVTITGRSASANMLATIVMTIFAFTERYPRRAVIFQGASTARNRLYRITIHKLLADLGSLFEVSALVRGPDARLHIEPFGANRHCEAFIVRRVLAAESPNPPP
jgi:hypothetical protein